MSTLFNSMLNAVTCGDCVDVMAHLPARSVDFVLTDPPYLVRYHDRSGRRVGWVSLRPARSGPPGSSMSFCKHFLMRMRAALSRAALTGALVFCWVGSRAAMATVDQTSIRGLNYRMNAFRRRPTSDYCRASAVAGS